MRNYYEALGVNRSASVDDIQQALDALSPEQLADEDDISTILLDNQRNIQYRRVHLQYEAIAAAINSPQLSGANNAHSWDKRVVEFNPTQDTVRL